MKKEFLFALIIAIFMIAPSFANVTIEETTDAEHLINSGYSQAVAEDVFVLKNRAAGKPIEPLYEKNDKGLVKTWKKFFSYIDPAQENYDRIHHDIKLSPSPSDL